MIHPSASTPGKRSGLNNSAFKALNATAFTPMPMASVRTASVEKPGRASKARNAKRRSLSQLSIGRVDVQGRSTVPGTVGSAAR